MGEPNPNFYAKGRFSPRATLPRPSSSVGRTDGRDDAHPSVRRQINHVERSSRPLIPCQTLSSDRQTVTAVEEMFIVAPQDDY